MDLKEIFGEELANQLSASADPLTKQVVTKLTASKLVVDDGKLVPQYRVKELTDEVDSFKKLVKKGEDDLKALADKAKGNEELTKQITEAQAATKAAKEEAAKEVAANKKKAELTIALVNAGVNSVKARETLMDNRDLAGLEIGEDGKLKGFEDKIKLFQADPAFKSFFGDVKRVGQEHEAGSPPPDVGSLKSQYDEALKKGDTVQAVAIKQKMYESKG